MTLFERSGNFEIRNQKIKIKYLANHYYLPVIVSETEKIDYLNHIINVDSEVRFIEQLKNILPTSTISLRNLIGGCFQNLTKRWMRF